MLVLSRRCKEVLVIDGPCKVVVLETKSNGTCRIGIIADREVKVMREELVERKKPA